MGSCGSKPDTKTNTDTKKSVQAPMPELNKQRTTKDKSGQDMDEGVIVPLANIKNNKNQPPNPKSNNQAANNGRL